VEYALLLPLLLVLTITVIYHTMGFLGSIRKRVNTRMKRKRTSGESLKFSSTSEFTDDSSAMESVDTPSKRRMEKTQSEDTQELLSPRDGEADSSFVFDPIMVSDDDTTDDEKPMKKDNEDTIMMNDEIDFRMKDETMEDVNYISDDSDREFPQEQVSPCHVSLIRSHTPPNALLPTHARVRPETQQQVMHIFHDELATLYEEPNKSSESLDSIKSSPSSVVENSNTSVVRALDESNIRARWEYALRLMVGNCEPSELLYNSIAEMMPSISNGEDVEMEIAEI